MARWMRVAAGLGLAVALVGGGGLLVLQMRRGPTGATRDYGGELPASAVPEFTSMAAERWVNGPPTSLASARGQVVIIEAWHPA